MARRTGKKGPSLGKFEGRDIVATGLIIRKTGDGLNEAMQVEPRMLKTGEHVYVVLECDVVDVHHPVEDRKDPETGGVVRVHVLDAGTATFIDADVVTKAIDDQAVKNQRWREEQAGVQRIPGTDLHGDHLAGKHRDGIVENCDECEREVNLAKSGK